MTAAGALNRAIGELWNDREFSAAITGVIIYPVMWVVSWWIGRKITKESQ